MSLRSKKLFTFNIMYMSKVLFWTTAHINFHFIQKYTEQLNKIEDTILRDTVNHIKSLLALIYLSKLINVLRDLLGSCAGTVHFRHTICRQCRIICIEYNGNDREPHAPAQCFSALNYYNQHNSRCEHVCRSLQETQTLILETIFERD